MTAPEPDVAELVATIEVLREQLDQLAAQSEFQADGLSSLESNLTSIAVAMTDQPVTGSEPTDTAPASGTARRRGAPTSPAGGDEGEGESVLSALDNGAPTLSVLRPWVIDNISTWCERKMAENAGGTGNGMRWCERWDEHPEAITRLWAIRAQQLIAADEGASALSAYLRDHFDNHLAVLTAATGPFHKCSPEKHEPSLALERRFLPTRRTALHVVAG